MKWLANIPSMSDLITNIGEQVDQIFTSDEERGEVETAQMRIKLQSLLAELKEQHMQLQINLQQASHVSIFVAGARPAIIWIGALGLAYEALIQPIGSWLIMRTVDLESIMGAAALKTATAEQIQTVMQYYQLPNMNTELFMPIILGVLGIGGFRTWEKIRGKSRDNLHPIANEYAQLSQTMLMKYQTEKQKNTELLTKNPSLEQYRHAQQNGTFVPRYLNE